MWAYLVVRITDQGGEKLYCIVLNSENRLELRIYQRVRPLECLGVVCQYQELHAKICFCIAGNENVANDQMVLFLYKNITKICHVGY